MPFGSRGTTARFFTKASLALFLAHNRQSTRIAQFNNSNKVYFSLSDIITIYIYISSSISSIVKFSQFKPLTISTHEINFNQFIIILNKVYEFMTVCLVVLTIFVAWQPFTYYHVLLVAEALSSLQTLFKFYNKKYFS